MTRLWCLVIFWGLSLEVSACNIPVFRYALERWQQDSYELVVFYDRLSTEQESFVAELEALSHDHDGVSNVNIVRSKVDNASGAIENNTTLFKAISASPDFKLPYAVVRSQAGQGRAIQPWHGPLDEAQKINLIDSPIRQELVRRLQNGHSIVWLMMQSKDTKQTAAMSELLKSQCEELGKKIKLPDGIGLPGSELHSEVPLLVKFSYLEIDPTDPREQFLVRLIGGIHSELSSSNEPLIVPVFGRGRALEVIPASDVNPELMEDLTLFMSGACSCQVKERNPGFDLLLSTDWDRQLFGENGLRPPPAKTVADREPTLLTIPPGRKR
ncbi:MAG: hypothetical protein SGI77_15740 [Pirellulaceae bacterium]|nr:hypothetical protein [Pirellulaceae bacterium]